MEALLKLENITSYYDDKPIIKNLSMELDRNKITAIIGPSGCGKSTLLRCINGMLRDEKGASMEGKIFLDGTDLEKMEKTEVRRRIGLVFQIPTPFPFSVYKNMAYAPKYYGMKEGDKLNRRIEEKLKQAGLYEEVKEDLQKSALKLSGGDSSRGFVSQGH